MKKMFLSLLLISVRLIIYGQSEKEKDLLTIQICNAIKTTKNISDSQKVFLVYNKYVTPFLSNYKKEKWDEIADGIYFRLQRNCQDFHDILDRINPPKGDWQKVAEKPITKLDKKTCIHFLDYKRYHYIEANGDTVNLSIENGLWIDKFKDGTYSKLKFNWVNDCEFDIEFIESNNITRKNYSRPGDKYRYQIFDQKEHYYLLSVETSGTNQYTTFKLYY